MQSRKLTNVSALLLALCVAGNLFAAANAAPSLETQEVQVIKAGGDTQFVRYLDAVRQQNAREAQAALIAKLRQMRDDLRNYAVIARGGKMTDEQRAAANVLKAIKDNVAALLAKNPGTNLDPQDNSQLDPMLFELGSQN
jgi:hypothetical protein